MISDFSKSNLFIILLLNIAISQHSADFNKRHLNFTKPHFSSIPTGWSITFRSLQLINNKPNLLFNSYLDYIKKSKNATMHAIYGNRVNKCGYNPSHFNKGNSDLFSKIDDIKLCAEKLNPDVLHIAEANLQYQKSNTITQLSEYELIQSTLANKIGYSRNVFLIKNKIKYRRLPQFETDPISSIWLEIFPPKSKSIYVNGYYRQWNLPKQIRDTNSNTNKSQIERYELYLENWTSAMKSKKDIMMMGDDNIDTLDLDKSNMSALNSSLYSKLSNQLEAYNMVIHNDKPTRNMVNTPLSLIDHIYSNCPKKISNVKTHNCNFSDHSILSFTYTTKGQVYTPKFRYIRNFKLLNANTLNLHISQSFELNSIFNTSDPNKIAETLFNELTLIINTIAPQNCIQVKSKHADFLTPELVKKINENHKLLTNAINTKNIDDWRAFKNDKTQLNLKIKEAKTQSLTKHFSNKKPKWKKLKEMSGNNKQCPPTKNVHKNNVSTSI